ncbi:ATP dependent DNA ligase domain-containing protein [Rhodotorula diobovata]|uniref:DNA ligase n=1 Tax=Rhodotorula diobovata TaxID=5288 RepID=A0A5C5G237_9BASI|nr:ATP dependent DNA ligase domain-containing protein [Rhodotorula diobovata]
MPKPSWKSRRREADDDDDDDSNGAGALADAQPDELIKPAGIENGPTPPFGTLCGLFEQFESITRNKHKKNEKKGEVLARFFERWRSEVGPDLYPVIRLMLPERDTRRRTYNLKEQKLAKALIAALDIPPNNSTALKLLNWKVPTAKDPGAGEFASVAMEVIKSRSLVIRRVSDTSIDSINEILDQLAHTKGAQPDEQGRIRSLQAEHARILKACVQKMTPSEMKWLIRIILRDLKIGMGEKTIFDRLHRDAARMFNTCSDIMRVCWTLYDPNYSPQNEDFTVVPGRVFRPMLCYRTQRNLHDVIKSMRVGRGGTNGPPAGEYGPQEFLIEEKLDGERIQMHKQGGTFLYSSRKNKDYTYLYGNNKDSGSLTPYIQDCLRDDIEDLVLDGEMLVWDPVLGKYMPFGNLKTFALAKTFGSSDPRPCFKVFDVLYVKGKNGEGQALIGKSLWQRKKLLSQLVRHKQGVIEIADCTKGSTTDDIRRTLERIMDERGEGLVIKHPLSLYQLGGREHSWIKIKPEYMDQMGERIDGLVVGGYWGQGHRSGFLASYLIGLRDEVSGKVVYKSFAKIGSGLNRSDYAWIIEQKRDKWIEFDRKRPETVPSWFKTVNEWPDVLIAPEDSFVIEIKASEIVGGVDYGAGMTLRFPRALKIREDKDAESAADLTTVQHYRSGPQKRSIGDDMSVKKKATRLSRSDKATAISTAVDQVESRSDLFQGITFFVFATKPVSLKDELQKQIVEHGGTYIQKIPNEGTDRIVIASEYKGITSRTGGKTVDVYHPDWVLDSIKQGRRIPPRKRYLVHATDATAELSDYANSDADIKEDDDEKANNDGYMATPPSPVQRRPFETAYRNFGEAALDSEDEPQTQSDDDADRVAQLHRVDSDDEGEKPAFPGGFESYFPRRGAMPAEVNAVNHDVSRLELESALSHAGTDDLGAAGVDDLKLESNALDDAQVGVGAGGSQTAHDPAFLFRPLVAYFDTREGAQTNGLTASSKPDRIQARADSELGKARTAFTSEHGIATSDLSDPKLTHIVVSKLIPERYVELVRRTSEPRYRRLVTTEWVHSCIEEEDLVDEDDFKP